MNSALQKDKPETISFKNEPLFDHWDEFIFLGQAQWDEYQELDVPGFAQPMNPDKERYLHLSKIGWHQYYTARDANGNLVGHCGVYIDPSMHTGEKLATEDTLYFYKKHRGDGTARAFLHFLMADLKDNGVKEFHVSMRADNEASKKFAKHLGFTLSGYTYLKEL